MSDSRCSGPAGEESEPTPCNDATAAEQSGAEQTADEQAGTEQRGDEPTGGGQTGDDSAGSSPIDDGQSRGEQTAAEQTVTEQTAAEQTAAEQTADEPTGDERTGRARSRRPASQVPDEEACLVRLVQLAGLVVLGHVKPAQANVIKSIYTELLQHNRRSAVSKSGQGISNADVMELMRHNPQILSMIEPLLTDEQVAIVMKDLQGEQDG